MYVPSDDLNIFYQRNLLQVTEALFGGIINDYEKYTITKGNGLLLDE